MHILTAMGRPAVFRVVSAGPGDWNELTFNAFKGVRDYYLYFGDDKTHASPEGKLNTGGLLMEGKGFGGGGINSAEDLERVFNTSTRLIGSRMIQRPFLGINLFGNIQPIITRLSGKFFVPGEGTYVFAIAANERGGLFIDGKPLVYSRHPVGDVRFQERTRLTRGWHDFTFYQATAGDYGFSVVWKQPGAEKFELLNRESFGLTAGVVPGPLEQKGKPLTADLQLSYLGESFFAWNYSHRYRFELPEGFRQGDRVTCEWNFGDGQTATGKSVEHVFVNAATYPVTVEVKLPGKTDSQTFRIPADRDWEHADRPPTDDPAMQSKIVAAYDLSKLPPDQTAWAVLMHVRADNVDAAFSAATALTKAPKHGNIGTARKALLEIIDMAIKHNAMDRLRGVFDAAPAESDLNPFAAMEYAQVLMYRLADFPSAQKVMEPFSKTDDATRRVYGQALILNGHLEAGSKILEQIPIGVARQKGPAVAGAMARTTEFYVEEKEAEHAEEAWNKWMSSFPAEFSDGNAALLRARIMALRSHHAQAAKLAEAYANANPQSAYAPRLIDLAAKLLEKTDAAKARALHELLQQRYPEDPLSQ